MLAETAATTPAQREEARRLLADCEAPLLARGRQGLAMGLRRGAGWTLRRLGLR